MTDSCQLGGYSIALVKQGRALSTAGAKLRRIEYGRALDTVSSAQVDLITAGKDCCGQLGAVDHWNTDLVVSAVNPVTQRDEVVWRGPVTKVRYTRGSVQIVAKDVLAWAQVRALVNDLRFTDLDVTDIFAGIWQDAVASIDAPKHELSLFPSNVKESRVIEAANLRMAWNVIDEMLRAGLDVTTFGSRVIVGLPGLRPIELTDQDVQGEVMVEKDGDEFADRYIANAAKDIVGIAPVGPRQGANGYPLVEGLVVDTQLPDVASAQAAAQAAYDFSGRGVRRVRAAGGLVLLPSSGIDVRRLIAGQPITFSATETCYAARETLRLGRLTVVVESGKETATIELQPLGSQGLAATL